MTHEPLPNRNQGLPEERYYSGVEGDQWSDELRDVLEELSVNSLVSGADRSIYDPESGQLYVPTTPGGVLSLGTGTEWTELGQLVDPAEFANKVDSTGDTITGNLDIDGRLDVAGAIGVGSDTSIYQESALSGTGSDGVFLNSQGSNNQQIRTIDANSVDATGMLVRVSGDGGATWTEALKTQGANVTIPSGSLEVAGTTTLRGNVTHTGYSTWTPTNRPRLEYNETATTGNSQNALFEFYQSVSGSRSGFFGYRTSGGHLGAVSRIHFTNGLDGTEFDVGNGGAYVNGNEAWHAGNLDPSNLSDYLPLTGGELTGDMTINQGSSPRYYSHHFVGEPSNSRRYVILLEPYTGNAGNLTMGEFRCFRGSSSFAVADRVKVTTKSSNDIAEHSCLMDVERNLAMTNVSWRFVTCTYNGTQYLGLDYDARNSSRDHSEAIVFSGISNSTGPEHLTLVEYASHDAATIHNQEIYDSITPYTTGTSTERKITANTISLDGRARTSRVPSANDDVANKAYVDSVASGGGGGGGNSIHIDNYGADPSGATASDTALDNAVAAADEGDRIRLTDGTYRFDAQHIFNKSLVLDGTGSEIITTWNASYTSNLEPCFAFHGTRTGETALAGSVSRNDQVISVPDASIYSAGDGVLIRENGYLSRSYKPTRDVVDSVDTVNNTIRLKKGAQYDYDHTHVDTWIGRIEPVVRPRFENMTFVSGEGNIPAQTRFCRDAIYNDVSVVGYSRHALISWDDLGTRFRNCETSEPTSLEQSSGEAFFLVGGTDITIINPRIRNARRGIDIRSGTQNVVVTEPNMSDITLHGFSFHNDGTTHVNGSLKVIGGTISARQTDPDMTAYQTGNGFNTSSNATYQKFIGTTFRFRNRAGDIYGDNVTCRDCRFEPIEDVLDVLEIHSGASNITIEDCTWTNAGNSITRAVYLRDGADGVKLSGTIEGTYSQAAVRFDAATNVTTDLDIKSTSSYGYHMPSAGYPDNVKIRGAIRGTCTGEVINIETGNNIDIDVTNTAADSATTRGVRIYGGTDIELTGRYETPGRGIIISGSPVGVTIDGATVESNGGTQAIGAGMLAAGAAPEDVKVMNCDVSKGTNTAINFETAVNGLWIGFNTAGTVTPNAGSTVIFNSGNGGV